MLIWAGGTLLAVYVPVIDAGKITALYVIAAPDKLVAAGRQALVSGYRANLPVPTGTVGTPVARRH
jgi:hypothetical protein